MAIGGKPTPPTVLIALPCEIVEGVVNGDEVAERKALNLIRIRMKRRRFDG